MKLTARQIASFFLAAVWFTPLLFILVTTIEERLVHHRMMEKMELESVREIVVPSGQVTWLDDNEVWIAGHMFDVKSFRLQNGIYTFKGLFDEEETRLMLQLDESTGKNKEENKQLSQFFEWVPMPERNNENLVRFFRNNIRVFPSLQAAFFEQLLRAVLTPPPDFLPFT